MHLAAFILLALVMGQVGGIGGAGERGIGAGGGPGAGGGGGGAGGPGGGGPGAGGGGGGRPGGAGGGRYKREGSRVQECGPIAANEPPPKQVLMSCMNGTNEFLKNKSRPHDDIVSSIQEMEMVLGCTDSNESVIQGNLAAQFYKPKGSFNGLNFKAKKEMDCQKASTGFSDVLVSQELSVDDPDSLVEVNLPPELLEEGEDNTIMFCMIDAVAQFEELSVSGGRIYGISICNKNISGLNQRVNITVSLPNADIRENKEPNCTFLDFSSNDFKTDGCLTQWNKAEEKVICSCNHLTYFAVLMVSPKVSSSDAVTLSYISLIGSSISLIFLLLTVLMLIIHRQASSDVSMKIHMNLALALILLNAHFMSSPWAASLAPPGGCVYVAVMLHYSLLATFSWTAIEGFHLYLLLVRVFNIYVRRYLLKLGLLGWGVPAVVVSLVLIIDRSVYGLVTVIPPGNNTDTTLQIERRLHLEHLSHHLRPHQYPPHNQ
ncbi:adhesion G-protein coupled receptor G6-like isoform X1 [Alosa pseudoharengus]|uniref:adhesion G-protein coupled receptor G6-like isoform X1 n=1 Tax=Alosa pseudoharengus TaxID=34774 RepID=UPI003F8A9B98